MSTLPEPTASQRHLDSVNETEPLESNAVIKRITHTKSTSHYLARRLYVVFNDLGLLPHVPSGWLQPGPDGLSFRSLSVREADTLTLAVEDLAHGYRPRRPSVGPNQPPLF